MRRSVGSSSRSCESSWFSANWAPRLYLAAGFNFYYPQCLTFKDKYP
jgi:hypothetical protein